MRCPLAELFNSGETSNYQPRNLRSSATPQLVVPLETGTFQDSASRLFNNLPNDIKLETNAKTFVKKVLKFLETKAESALD